MSTVTIHIALAIVLFFVVNWVGEHSSSFGYLQLSIVPRGDPAPAFNWLLKTLAPTVYTIIVATICYICRRDSAVHGIWLVAVYYFAFRLFYNILLGRSLLLNWVSIFTQVALGTAISYLGKL